MPTALVANPRRRRRRRHHHHHASNPRRHRRRRGRASNPRRRRRAHNPGMGGGFVSAAKGTLKRAIGPSISAIVAGGVSGLASTKFADSPLISGLIKAGLGIAGAAVLRKNQANAWAFYGASIGSIGSDIGVHLGGGLVAHSNGQVMKKLADKAMGDSEMAALLAGAGVEDIGDLIDMGDVADDEDAMGDLVEEVAGLADYEEEEAA